MSMNYGSRRDRPRVRLLNEETEAEKYKRLGWDPRKTYEENMGYEGVFDRPDEELDWPNVAPQRPKPTRQVRELAAEGRGEDTEIAHVARGEYIIPRQFLTPELLTILRRIAAANGVPLERMIVGNARNRINPNTGAPEFTLAPSFSYVPNEGVQAPPADPAEYQSALNRLERQFIPDSLKQTTKDTFNAITNQALTPAQIDQTYDQVIRNIPLQDALKFRSVDPSGRPMTLTPEQQTILQNQINQLKPDDLRQTILDQYGTATKNGSVVCPTCGK